MLVRVPMIHTWCAAAAKQVGFFVVFKLIVHVQFMRVIQAVRPLPLPFGVCQYPVCDVMCESMWPLSFMMGTRSAGGVAARQGGWLEQQRTATGAQRGGCFFSFSEI